MGNTAIRRSVSLAPTVDTKIKALARQQNRSANQVIENLIEAGLAAKEAEKQRFFEVAERLRRASSATEVRQAKGELGKMIFGS